MKTLVSAALILVVLAAAGAAFRGCRTAPTPAAIVLDPPEPKPALGAEIGEQTRSSVSLPVTIKTSDLQDRTNATVPRKFQDRQNQELTRFLVDDWFSYNIDRGDIKLQAAQGRLHYSVPFSGEFSAGGRFKPRVLPSFNVQETAKPLAGTITGSTSVTVDSDWAVHVDPTVALQADKAEIGLVRDTIKIGVRQKLQDEFNKNAPAEARAAAAKAVKSLDVQGRVKTLWDSAHMVKSVATSPNLWLRVDPQEIRMKPIEMANDSIVVHLAVVANTSLFVAAEPPAPTARPLPNLIQDDNLSARFDLMVPAHISLAELETKLAKEVEGRQFDASDVRVQVSKISLRTSGDRVVLRFDFDAEYLPRRLTAKGRLFAVGRLNYHPATQSLSVADIDYDVETKNLLLRTADWLLRPSILSKAQAAASVDIAKPLEEGRKNANASIAAWKSPDGKFTPAVTVQELKLLDARVSHSQAFLLFRAAGICAVEVKP